MQNPLFTLALASALTLGVSNTTLAQDNSAQTPSNTQSLAQDQPAQPAARGPMRVDPDRQLQHMTRVLGLSADQQTQIKPLLVDRQQKMEAVFQDQSLAPRDRRAKMQSIRQDAQTKIEAVLSDQQKQTFESMRQQRGRGRGWQGGSQEGAPQPQ